MAATGSTVNAGSVTFTIKNGAATVGSATTDNSIVAGAAQVTYSLPGGLGAGTYTIEASYSGMPKFFDSSANGANAKTLTVGKAVLTVTAQDKTRQYSDPNPPLTVSYTGFKNGETLATSDVVGAPACSILQRLSDR